ncbi:hypothetical protein PIB30_051765 [Stylosanthes scabra]|uniref:Uncharacterized protein n=1 Tax=Stylosanthes scabra TaxID=79078 RepID=A0ABU6WKR4_9FABA|nr:hypothetical protein [Stylosanthes scabra]
MGGTNPIPNVLCVHNNVESRSQQNLSKSRVTGKNSPCCNKNSITHHYSRGPHRGVRDGSTNGSEAIIATAQEGRRQIATEERALCVSPVGSLSLRAAVSLIRSRRNQTEQGFSLIDRWLAVDETE